MSLGPTQEVLDTHFGVRNGVKGNPREGINFTRETLTYMTPKARADEITDMIVQKMRETGKPIPFGVFDATAGIGGNAMSFLDNDNVAWVVSYEIRPDRRDMLQKNITMYGLATRNGAQRSYVPDSGFTGVPPNYKDIVLYFDPPWLPPNIKGHESDKSQYIQENIPIGDKTLEQWISTCPQCSMIVARVPPGYRAGTVPGFNIQTVPITKALLVVATPTTFKPLSPVGLKPLLSAQEIKLPKGVEPYDAGWYKGFKQFLADTLKKTILPDNQQFVDRMLTDEAMEIWVPCFTDESYNPNVGFNYEKIEIVGDHAMEYSFINYLYYNYPDLSVSQISELKSHYISKQFQAQVSQDLNLPDWLRTNIQKDISTYEDILESFFGGINIVADKVFKFGAGFGLCYSMIEYIFKDIGIDLKYAIGKPKTQIKETFEQLHWIKEIKEVEEVVDGPNNTKVAVIKWTPAAIETLSRLGLNIKDDRLAVETAGTKNVALSKAYQTALDNIRRIGITDEWVRAMRVNQDKENPAIQPYIAPLERKIQAEGYVSYYLSQVKHTKNSKYYQLIGVKPDNTLVILAKTDRPTQDEWEGKKQVLNSYLA